ncbi:SDR family NAD(P)-dependent oxidoreductase [Pendulispora albinea]|uniref:SDR family oxidoreductase n=1 Tax=Pendulispora albinea TaxID=2741071 RepID=A0ABZ2LSN3_9BACT
MNHQDFSDQVVVITGASAGVGAATAEELARRGASVVLAARRAPELDEVRARCGDKALAVVADVTKRQDVQRIFDQAIAKFERIDIWINNAGRGQIRPVLEITDEDLDTMIRDNTRSVLYGMQVVTPHLQARGNGAIVNVSSIVARMHVPRPVGSYAAAKAAMSRLSDALRGELAQSHPEIRVVAVYPGAIATDFGQNALGQKADSRKSPGAQSAEDVAHIVCEAALKSRGDIYTLPNGPAMVREYTEKQLAPLGPTP